LSASRNEGQLCPAAPAAKALPFKSKIERRKIAVVEVMNPVGNVVGGIR